MLTFPKNWCTIKMQRGRTLLTPSRRRTWEVHFKKDWRRVRCTAKPKVSTPTARHNSFKICSRAEYQDLSAPEKSSQANLTPKRWRVHRAATAAGKFNTDGYRRTNINHWTVIKPVNQKSKLQRPKTVGQAMNTEETLQFDRLYIDS